MKQEKNDIRELLSARLRPTRKGPTPATLRLVLPDTEAPVKYHRPEVLTPEQKEIAAANAIAAMTAQTDADFTSGVGKLTRTDVLCANQNSTKSKPNRK